MELNAEQLEIVNTPNVWKQKTCAVFMCSFCVFVLARADNAVRGRHSSAGLNRKLSS